MQCFMLHKDMAARTYCSFRTVTPLNNNNEFNNIEITGHQVIKGKSSDLDYSEAEEPLVEHDDLVLVAAVIHDVAQSQQ